MIKEKYKWYISIISMGLAVVLTTTAMFYSNSNSSNKIVTAKTEQTVLDKESVTDISIDIDESDWDWLIENATNEEFKSCNITINGETYYNVGIRPKGNTSLTNVASDDTTDRYSFKIKFNEYVEDQTYNGIESIVLNNMIQDNTYIKEYVTYDLYSKLGVATPEMSYSNITVNGSAWGFYLAIEVIDESYLESNFGTTEGNLYKPETMSVGGDDKAGGGDKAGGMGNPPEMNGDKQMGGPPDMQNNEAQENMAMPDAQSNESQGNMTTPGIENNQGTTNTPPDMQNQNGANEQIVEPNGNNADAQNQSNENQQAADLNGESADSQNQNNAAAGNNKAMNPGGGRATEGADFIYIDDNVSSYSIVRDSAVLKSTTDSDFERVINMYKNLQDGTNLEEVLDVEEVLKYFAVNTFVINLDSYSGAMYHNYYLYEKDGKCQILPWDLNLSFGGYGVKNGGGNAGNAGDTTSDNSSDSMINFPIDNPVTGSLDSMPLIGKLLEVDEYKELYHSYLQQIADEYFNSGYYENLVNKLDTLISDYVKEDPTAFCTYDEYKTAINEMITFGKDRTTSVLAQLSGEQPSTTYGNIESTVNISAMGDMGGGMSKGDKDNMGPQNNMQNSENTEATEDGTMQKPGEGQVTEESIESTNSQNTGDSMAQSPMNNANNENQQANSTENTNENMQNDKMNNVNVGGMVHNNATQDNTKNYLFIAGLFVLGMSGIVFATKFKRKRR